MRVPQKATSVCQPADATWNGPLKVRLRNRWIRHLREQLRARQPGVTFKLKAPDRKLLISWIHDTWSAVHASTISAGFKKCGFIERLDANDEDASTPAATNEMLENAGDIVDEVLSAGCLDKSVGAFSVDDDFDDMFRAVCEFEIEY
ncbi:unnamed protein product [Phytophthora lilii]|uniref:Unnamed protein product n=1 Tax=Phytophthora lilii TaxID=2077276 RepID=A0A9W6UB69_9STRA|nr:unnamed protein product [Phytophthora lilii]